MLVIAGVTGHVGKVVATQLLDGKQKVKVLVRDPKKGEDWSRKGAEVAVASLGDEAALTRALRGATGLFVLLPPPPLDVPDLYAFQRTTAHAIAAAVQKSGVPHVVMLSSIGGELAEATGPIKGLHLLEELLRATGTKLTVIRAGYFQENIGTVVGAARQAGVFPSFLGELDRPFPMIATRDIGMLAAELLRAPRAEIVDLHGPAYSQRQVADQLGRRLGKTLQIVQIPPSEHVAAMERAGLSRTLSEAFAEMYAAFASGRVVPSGDRFVQGQTTLEQTIDAMFG
jgi:uncharacterized protein YbjT (DUF2867 family)